MGLTREWIGMANYKPPILIDAFRLTGSSHSETVDNLVQHYKAGAGGWNHQRSAFFIRTAFDGVSDTASLVTSCRGRGTKAQIDNAKIVESVLPKVVGRATKTFPYRRTYFAITPTARCSMGPAFYVVEKGAVKLVYIHARTTNRAELHHIAPLAYLVKSEILEQDFYGEPADVEIHYVDKAGTNRDDLVLSLSSLQRYLNEPPLDTLTRFAKAFVEVDEGRLAGEVQKRKATKTEPPEPQESFPF